MTPTPCILFYDAPGAPVYIADESGGTTPHASLALVYWDSGTVDTMLAQCPGLMYTTPQQPPHTEHL